MPFKSAARARQTGTMPATPRLMAQFAVSPRKSSASACKEAEPAAMPLPISARNMTPLTARAIHKTRRHAGLLGAGPPGEHDSSLQQPAMLHPRHLNSDLASSSD